jgi:uncharacterized protein
MSSVTFTQAADALTAAKCGVTAAEAHGCLCGSLCVDHSYTLDRWLDELFEAPSSSVPEMVTARELLVSLHRDTVLALADDQMTFSPLLPSDELHLAARADALAQWCQGFLFAFGAGAQHAPLPTAVDEVLRDLSQIARAHAGDTEPTEDDESDYAEIVEYVRVGAQLVYDDFRPMRQRAGKSE